MHYLPQEMISERGKTYVTRCALPLSTHTIDARFGEVTKQETFSLPFQGNTILLATHDLGIITASYHGEGIVPVMFDTFLRTPKNILPSFVSNIRSHEQGRGLIDLPVEHHMVQKTYMRELLHFIDACRRCAHRGRFDL